MTRYAIPCVLSVALVLALGIGFGLSGPAGAQDDSGTPTPIPTLAIDIFAPTPTPLPPTVTQLIGALEQVGLQQAELPGQGVFADANPDNGTYTMTEQRALWGERYPDSPLVEPLAAAYLNNGVLATSLSEFTAETCAGLTVYGLGSWIRLMTGESSAQALLADPSIGELYAELWGWQPVTSTLPLYTVADTSDLCDQPGTLYVYEYAQGRYVVGLRVYAPDSTDVAVVEGIMQQLAAVINARIETLEILPTPTPPPTFTPVPIVSMTPRFTPTMSAAAINITGED